MRADFVRFLYTRSFFSDSRLKRVIWANSSGLLFNPLSDELRACIIIGKGFFNYRLFTGGSFVFWTENRNQGNELTKDLKGKKFAFFGDPQIWIKVKNGFSVGSRINVFYHLLTADDRIQIYPAVGLKFQF